jgi:hypothetical protein
MNLQTIVAQHPNSVAQSFNAFGRGDMPVNEGWLQYMAATEGQPFINHLSGLIADQEESLSGFGGGIKKLVKKITGKKKSTNGTMVDENSPLAIRKPDRSPVMKIDGDGNLVNTGRPITSPNNGVPVLRPNILQQNNVLPASFTPPAEQKKTFFDKVKNTLTDAAKLFGANQPGATEAPPPPKETFMEKNGVFIGVGLLLLLIIIAITIKKK